MTIGHRTSSWPSFCSGLAHYWCTNLSESPVECDTERELDYFQSGNPASGGGILWAK